jgi:hypothetical protein
LGIAAQSGDAGIPTSVQVVPRWKRSLFNTLANGLTSDGARFFLNDIAEPGERLSWFAIAVAHCVGADLRYFGGALHD